MLHDIETSTAVPVLRVADLAPARRWVAWLTELRNGRATKVPIRPASGLPARSNVPEDWTQLAEAERRAALLPPPTHGSKGCGLVLGAWPAHDDLRLGGVDLDACRDPATGRLEDWAVEALRLLDTYAEVSPSQTGVKAFFRFEEGAVDALRQSGLLPPDGLGRSFKRPGGGDHPPAIELHLGGRFYTVTDDRLADAPETLRVVPVNVLVELLGEIGPRVAGKPSRIAFGGDNSRSGVAFRLARDTKARGGSYEDFIAACQADPAAGAWLQEKGLLNGGRLARLTWEKAGGSAPAQPQSEGSGDDWCDPDMSLLTPPSYEPPSLPLEVFPSRWREWLPDAAEGKGAPIDYVAAALLTVAASLIGNARCAAPHRGWVEPSAVWTMVVGSPSAGKSPAVDAVLSPLRAVERALQREADARHKEWQARAERAEIALEAWQAEARRAFKQGKEPPPRPEGAGDEPHVPRLVVQDATLERLAQLAEKQPKGLLLVRDELAGLLGNLTRYANGGSDRPFFLEAWGGRAYVVERVSRPPVRVERLLISITGGIQPERLNELLLESDDDGLLARFLPVWPHPAPIIRDPAHADEGFVQAAFSRLAALGMPLADDGSPRPWFVPFSESARDVLFKVRQWVREEEQNTHGLLQSFLGKIPGFTARLALVLSYLAYAADPAASEPREIEGAVAAEAAALACEYFYPMARRVYGEASLPPDEAAARSLARLIAAERIPSLTIRDVQRRERRGLRTSAEIERALDVLIQAGWARPLRYEPGPRGGRPQIVWIINPRIGEVAR